MSKLSAVVIVLLLFAAPAFSAAADGEKITQEELVRRTQELFDAVAGGNRAPSKQYFAEDAVYCRENEDVVWKKL
jgi:hypothetical protein